MWLLTPHFALAVGGEKTPKLGEAPPPLQLGRILQGPSVSEVNWEALKGKVVVLEFWSTLCVPCVQAIPHWNQLVDDFTGQPVVFLSVSDENGDHVRQFLKRMPIKGWVALDGPLAATQSAHVVEGIPHTVLVDRQGRIAAITHPSKLEAGHLKEVLAGQPCSLPVPEPYVREGNDEVVSLARLADERSLIVEATIRGPFPRPEGAFGMRGWKPTGARFEARKAELREIVAEFFHVSPLLVIEEAKFPAGLYDVTIAGPETRAEGLAAQFTGALQTAFGLQVKTNRREFEVYALTLPETNAPNRKLVFKSAGGGGRPGGFQLAGSRMAGIISFLESAVDRPVVDETGDTNRWSVELNWEMSPGEILIPRIARKLDRAILHQIDTITFADLPASALAVLDEEDRELLKAELSKPSARRFRPDPAKVIRAAKQQLGLDLKPVSRSLTVVEIRATRAAP